MVVMDKRESLIVSTASHFFGVQNDELNPEDQMVLDKFLDNATCRTLFAQIGYDEDIRKLKLRSQPTALHKTLVFFKVSHHNKLFLVFIFILIYSKYNNNAN